MHAVSAATHHATQCQVQIVFVSPLNHFQDRAAEPHAVDDVQHLLLGFLQQQGMAQAHASSTSHTLGSRMEAVLHCVLV